MWIVELRLNTLGTRVLSGVTWSALNEAVYPVGPRAENLRITEIMYHPQNPDEESIELANVGDETVNLSLMRFAHHVDSVFGGLDLAAGELAVVIHDRIAFETRHGTGVRIAGSYTNDRYEYVELQNIGNEPVTLHNPAGGGPWKFTDGIEFAFSADSRVTMAPGRLIVVVRGLRRFLSTIRASPPRTFSDPTAGI